MQLLSQIIIHRKTDEATIQLLQGDLTAIPTEHASDIVVISAYPGSYLPIRGTLMAALYDKGIFIGEMEKDKEVNLVDQLGCWLSKPLKEKQQKQFNFKRILCFEPGSAVLENESVVGNIFRCINIFAFDKQNSVIAMPVVASGNQKVPLAKMLPATLEAAVFWLENGLPLNAIKLVLYSDKQVNDSLLIFNAFRDEYELLHSISEEEDYFPGAFYESEKNFAPGNYTVGSGRVELGEYDSLDATLERSPSEETAASAPSMSPLSPVNQLDEETGGYDYFLSYAHTNSDLINSFVENLQQQNKQLRIFYDKDSIPPGGLWIKQISDAIQKAGKVLVFLSPDYDNSLVCWDEFQCAKLMEYNRKTSVIQTIYLYNYKNEMPPIMGIYSYLDCREGDKEKLISCISEILK
jgi:hypothetical protein